MGVVGLPLDAALFRANPPRPSLRLWDVPPQQITLSQPEFLGVTKRQPIDHLGQQLHHLDPRDAVRPVKISRFELDIGRN